MVDEIAYRQLKPGNVIQPGDEWQAKNGTGAWLAYNSDMYGLRVLDASIARRPYNITQLQKQQREASEAVAVWQRAGQAACKERDEAKAAMQEAQNDCDFLQKDRDRLANAVNDLLKKNQRLTRELARLQQPPPAASHIVDANKMVESEFERKAWELWLRGDNSIEDAWRKAEHFITERNRRRKEQENQSNGTV